MGEIVCQFINGRRKFETIKHRQGNVTGKHKRANNKKPKQSNVTKVGLAKRVTLMIMMVLAAISVAIAMMVPTMTDGLGSLITMVWRWVHPRSTLMNSMGQTLGWIAGVDGTTMIDG